MRALVVAALVGGCSGAPAGGGGDGGAPGNGLPALALAACVTAESCGLDRAGVSACTRTLSGVSLPDRAAQVSIDAATVACLAAARIDCDAARRCLNGGQTPVTCPMPVSRCLGTVLESCTDATGMGTLATAKFDCASAGLACVAVTTAMMSTVQCALSTCGADPPSCSGTRLRTCDAGFQHSIDCGAVGASCASAPARCRGLGPQCSTSTLDPGKPLRCEGSVLVRCWDGQEARFDCAAIGEDCFPVGASFGCGLGNQCDPTAFSSTCAGAKLSICDNGKLATIDCVAAGFSSCDAFNGRCAP